MALINPARARGISVVAVFAIVAVFAPRPVSSLVGDHDVAESFFD
jgi:hypothetical protein